MSEISQETPYHDLLRTKGDRWLDALDFAIFDYSKGPMELTLESLREVRDYIALNKKNYERIFEILNQEEA